MPASPKPLRSDLPFYSALIGISSVYLLLIIGLLVGNLSFAGGNVSGETLRTVLSDKDIQHSVWITIASCSVTAVLSILFAVPAGYVLSRFSFRGKSLVDALIDIPILLPPMVIGLSLLILFHMTLPGGAATLEDLLGGRITYHFPAIVLAQFPVACAFAIRTMRTTFDEIDPRGEQVAQTLGCNRGQAFFRISLPSAWRGVSTAGTLAWARAMGEFGPVLVFAGAIRGRTEVLSTSVFLEISNANLESAVIISLLMVTIAIAVLLLVRVWGPSRVEARFGPRRKGGRND